LDSTQVYDARSAALLHTYAHPALRCASPTARIALSPCGTHAAAPSATGDALVFDATTGLHAQILKPPGLNTPAVAAVAWSADRTRLQLATVDKAGTLALWD